jgi:hypothetical protein
MPVPRELTSACEVIHPDIRLGPRTSLVFAVAFVLGCSAKHPERLPVFPVEGAVTLNGQPLPNALVILHAKGPNAPQDVAPRGQTDLTGKFKITSYESGDGAPPGEYTVTVVSHRLINNGGSTEPGPNVLHPKLADPKTTDLSAVVVAGANVLPLLEVRR